jgi:23S rRNA A2030 N6-methylase RlmJ
MFKDAKLENVIFPSLCKQILEADSSIRFVGVANKFGTQIASQYRKGLVPLLTESQSQLSIIESAIRMYTRIEEKDVKSKLGNPIYSFTLYEKKIKRATFLLENEDYPILMVSFDKEEDAVAKADHGYVTLNKILSIVKEQIRLDK